MGGGGLIPWTVRTFPRLLVVGGGALEALHLGLERAHGRFCRAPPES